MTEFLKPSVSGFLLQKELDYLDGAVSNPKRPFAAIVGGSKVSSKIGVIESLMAKCDKLIIGGGMVFTFLKAKGLSTGSSLVSESFLLIDITHEREAARDVMGLERVNIQQQYDARTCTYTNKNRVVRSAHAYALAACTG